MTSGRLVLFFMAPALVVDAVNGWLIRVAPGSGVSVSYRILLLAIILLWLASHSRRALIWACGAIGTIMLCTAYHSIYFKEVAWLTLDFHFQVRLITHFIYFLFLYTYSLSAIKSGQAEAALKDIKMVVFFSYAFVVVNIVLGLLGVGYAAHRSSFAGSDEGYGGLGFFKAANDVSAAFIVIAGIVQYYVWNSYKGYGKYLLISMVSIFAAIGLQSKVSLLGMMLVIGGIPLVSSGLLSGSFRLKKKPFILVTGAVLVAVSLFLWLIFSEAAIVQRFMWFYEKRGLIYAVMTGRNYYVGMAWEVFDKNYLFPDILFGHGWSYFLSEMGRLYKADHLVEIDYFDIFMINGLAGVLLVGAIWGSYLRRAYRYAKLSAIGRAALFINLLLLGIAAGSGHVLYSVLNGLFIAILQVLPMLEYAVKSEEKRKIEAKVHANVAFST